MGRAEIFLQAWLRSGIVTYGPHWLCCPVHSAWLTNISEHTFPLAHLNEDACTKQAIHSQCLAVKHKGTRMVVYTCVLEFPPSENFMWSKD